MGKGVVSVKKAVGHNSRETLSLSWTSEDSSHSQTPANICLISQFENTQKVAGLKQQDQSCTYGGISHIGGFNDSGFGHNNLLEVALKISTCTPKFDYHLAGYSTTHTPSFSVISQIYEL